MVAEDNDKPKDLDPKPTPPQVVKPADSGGKWEELSNPGKGKEKR